MWIKKAMDGIQPHEMHWPTGNQMFQEQYWTRNNVTQREAALFLLGEFRATSPTLYRILCCSGADLGKALQLIIQEMEDASGTGWPLLIFP